MPADQASGPALPRFDEDVPQRGYRWWYLDGVSDDGLDSLSIIAFVGSVFSPYYFQARKGARPDPANHCALNLGLYGRNARAWTMTERSARFVQRGAKRFQIGPSALEWRNGSLEIDIDEIAVPIPRRICGKVILTPQAICNHVIALAETGKHVWRPVAPHCRIEVRFERPALSWSGTAYHDMNWGEGPLEDAFQDWTWSRAATSSGSFITYETRKRDGTESSLALAIDSKGVAREAALPPRHQLPPTLWRMPRVTRSEMPPQIIETCLDAPFYARTLMRTRVEGEDVIAFHESLSLDRFRNPVVRAMLPFRMPRRG